MNAAHEVHVQVVEGPELVQEVFDIFMTIQEFFVGSFNVAETVIAIANTSNS